MSSTNTTTHYSLPSFLGSDKPSWLVDWNGAMAAIDTAIYEAKTVADGAASAAATNAANIATLSSTVSGQGTDLSALSGALTTLTGTVNTITELIGNGTPTTTDHTIIGAINEINSVVSATSTIIIDDIESLEVVADGVKDNETLMNELAISFGTLVAGLGDDEYIEVLDTFYSGLGHLIPFANKIFYNTTYPEISSTSTFCNGTAVNIDTARLELNAIRLFISEFSAAPSLTINDRKNLVPAADSKHIISYRKYKMV